MRNWLWKRLVNAFFFIVYLSWELGSDFIKLINWVCGIWKVVQCYVYVVWFAFLSAFAQGRPFQSLRLS